MTSSSNPGFNTTKSFLNHNVISTKESNFPAKNTKHLLDTENSENLNCKKAKYEVDQNLITSQPLLETKKSFEKYLFCEKFVHMFADSNESEEIDAVSLNSSSSLNNRSSLMNLPGPSNLTEQPYTINSTTKSTENSIQVKHDELKSNRLFNVQKTIHSSNFPSPTGTSEKTIKAMPLVECTTDNNLFTEINSKILNSGMDSEMRITEKFVKDLEIFDSDVLYNVTLMKQFLEQQMLVKKISKTPFDKTLLQECLFLQPIPKKKPGPKTFTQKKIENFTKGISKHEYSDIDLDDWNKTMVKRAAIFTAHSGLLTASEESLYILADVAIDFIKNLALIMKKKFGIEKNNSCPDSINPINKSLVQDGVKGSLEELIKHNDNYIFERSDILLKKCQSLQTIIDKYVDQHMTSMTISNQSYINDYFVQENPVSEVFMIKDEITLNENKDDVE